MIAYDHVTKDILSLFSYFNYQNLLKSLLFRKQARLTVAENSAMIVWGPSILIGGEFSEEISEKLQTILQRSDSARYINVPEGEWNSSVQRLFPNEIKEMQINLYQTHTINEIKAPLNDEYITPITQTLLERNLPNTQLITDELYSYKDIEDFFQNGFGLALVIDHTVCGYCLSEYSIDNECGINIWVDEKYRGMGYATTMTKLFIQYCRERNWKAFWACTSDNTASNHVALSSGLILHSIQHYYEYQH